MYTLIEDYVTDTVRDDLSENDKPKVREAKKKLKKDPRPATYEAQQQEDGSWQISIFIGVRKILLGYDIDDKQRLITLNYLKWDRFREALDFLMGLLGPEPGKRK
jgi:hypothetical protein